MILYLLKMIACSGLFYGLYYLLLQREKMFVFNRVYLLVSVVLAIFIPLIPVKQALPGKNVFVTDVDVIHKEAVSEEPAIAASKNFTDSISIEPTKNNAIEVSDILIVVYLLITIYLIIRLLMNFFYIVSQSKNSRWIDYKGVKLIHSEEAISPYSFLKYIFINDRHYCDEHMRSKILEHEMAHIKQGHSWDIIFMELATAVFWFNPFLFLIKRSIKINHEFLADDAVIRKGYSVSEYGNVLLVLLQKYHQPYLGSGFNFLTSKKRLIMMVKTSSQARLLAMKSIAGALIIILVMLFGSENRVQAQDTKKAVYPSKEKVSSGDGVPQYLIDEYEATLQKATSHGITKDGKKITGIDMRKINTVRMDSIYYAMSREQRSKATTIPYAVPSKPLVKPSKIRPTEKQYELWKRPDLYGVWIDGKKVPNAALNRYKAADFVYYTASKLYGAAKKNVKYQVQLDLYTKTGYENTYQSWANSKEEYYKKHYYRDID